MRRLFRVGLLIVFSLTSVALAQTGEHWRTGLRIIPWVADGYVTPQGDRYQTTITVFMTEGKRLQCTVEAEGVELIGPSGERASKHIFQLYFSDREATPEVGTVWSAKTPSDGPLATGYVVVDCTVDKRVYQGMGVYAQEIIGDIEAYATFSLFDPGSELKTEAAVFSSDCRFSSPVDNLAAAAWFAVDTTGGARMAFALANISNEHDTYLLVIPRQGLGEELVFGYMGSPIVSITVPPKTAKAFFLDELVDVPVPEAVFELGLSRSHPGVGKIPFGAIGLRYTDGTFSTVPAWPSSTQVKLATGCGGH